MPTEWDWRVFQQERQRFVVTRWDVDGVTVARLRVAYDFDRDTQSVTDRVFLKVNRIAGSGL